MKHLTAIAAVVAVQAALAGVAWGQVLHRDVQAVDEDGVGTFQGAATLTGVLLYNPELRFDATPNFIPWQLDGSSTFRLGAQWEIFVQAVDSGDRGGTACWMGQNYGNLPWLRNSALSYTNDAWQAEMDRLNHDPATGRRFREGDLIRVVASNTLFYSGKTNVNEAHSISPSLDFSLELIDANVGLPEPEAISLAAIKDANDAAIFDPDRLTGGEYYQGVRVIIEDVTLVDAGAWGSDGPFDDRACTITDATGRTLTARMPRSSVLDFGDAPDGTFDVIGVIDQLSGSSDDGTTGYELFVTDIAGDPGDITLDGVVSEADLGILAAHWQDVDDRLTWRDGDLNFDGRVSEADLGLLAAHWQEGVVPPTMIPEPTTLAMLVVGGLAIARRRPRH